MFGLGWFGEQGGNVFKDLAVSFAGLFDGVALLLRGEDPIFRVGIAVS